MKRFFKRFFLVLSILMILFLVLMAGSIAAMQFGAIETRKPLPPFVFGHAITTIPYNGERVVYPNGDVFLIRQTKTDAGVAEVILFNAGEGQGFLSGLVTGKQGDAYQVEIAGGRQGLVPMDQTVGVYVSRIRGFVATLQSISSPLSVLAFALALAASITVWKVIPGKPASSGLSRTDGEISSVLY